MVKSATTESAWSPFRHLPFAVLWTAMLLSNVGGWMHDVGAGWLMTTLNPSPLWVSLVQAATTLPVFLLALPAGALADMLNRRRLLIIAMWFMAIIAFAIGTVVALGRITPVSLLAFTLAMGVGTAMLTPAWQSIVPQLVPRQELAAAVALNSVGFNVSRAIGPALGGAAIAAFGLASPFLMNAVSFVIVIGALLWWRPLAQTTTPLPAERWVAAMRAGVRYVRSSQPLKATLLRAIAFLVFASAFWALLPLLAREQLGGGVGLYGVLVTCIGAGAVGGALVLPMLRKRHGPARVVLASSVITAAVLVSYALNREPMFAAVTSVIAGGAWIAAVSSFNISAQMSLPDWVRARGLAVFSAVFFGSLAAGSTFWGQVATMFGIPTALLAAAGGALAAAAIGARVPLQAGGEHDFTPSSHWPQPIVSETVEQERGPVMVTIEYRIDARRTTEFLAALEPLAQSRRRDGAFAWGVFRDAAEPGRMLEYFFEESWLDHLRHHARVTQSDRELQARVQAFHTDPTPPRVSHFVPADGVTTPAAQTQADDGSLQ